MLNPLEMERFIRATAKRADLRVQWEDIEMPRTDGATVYLPRITSATTEEQYKRLVFWVAHEVGHVLYSDFALLQRTGLGAASGLLGAINNIIEDDRIEYLGGLEYEGDRLLGSHVNATVMEEMVSRRIKPEAEEYACNMMPLMAWRNRIHADIHPDLHRVQPALDRWCAKRPEAQRIYDKLLSHPTIEDVLRNIRTIEDKVEGSKASLDLACTIYRDIFDADPEEAKRRAKEEMKKGKGEGGEGKGKGSGDGEDADGKSSGTEANAGEGEDKGESPIDKLLYGDYADHVPDAHDPSTRHYIGVKTSYRTYTPGRGYEPAQAEHYRVNNYADGSTPCSSVGGDWIHKTVTKVGEGFAQRVRRILQIRDRVRWQPGQKKGRLNQSSLHRLAVKDAPGYAERVFRKRTDTDVLDAAVTLLIDQSGSMGRGEGSKSAYAFAAAVMLNDVIGNTLHIPVEVVSFTANYRDVPMYVHRQHSDKLVPTDVLEARMSAATRNMSGNADGDSIMWAFDRLLKQRAKRKLLVVFSDGQPAGPYRDAGDCCAYTREVIQRIERESPVDIIGFGIMHDGVEEYYTQHKVITDTRELEHALLNLIENKLK